MRSEFEFSSPVKIVAGENTAKNMKHWAELYQAKKILIITGSHVSKSESFLDFVKAIKQDGLSFEIYDHTKPEPPMELVDELADFVRTKKFDLVIAVGGGSPMDTAKAVCMLYSNEGKVKEYLFGGGKVPVNPSLPLICIPTTAGSGSEVSAASVIEDTERHIKLSCTHPFLLPKAAILDPMMQLDMPAQVTAGTGMDAMTHAIEAYTSKNSTIFSDLYARRAIELIAKYLPIVMEEPKNRKGRLMMAQASSMAAIAFLNGGLGAVHGISQAMGGIAHTPHGISNAILLPKVMRYNYVGDVEKFAEIAQFLGCDVGGLSKEASAKQAVNFIRDLNKKIGISDNLSSLNVTKEMIPEIVKGTMGYRMLWMNPVEMTEELATKILEESIL